MELCLFPSVPNTSDVKELKGFYWVVSTGGTVKLRHGSAKKPVLELLTPGPVTPPVWMADVLSWPDRGEFLMALGRSVVVCLAVRSVRIRGQLDDSVEAEMGTFRVEGLDGQPAFLTYEWEEPLEFVPMNRDEAWLEAQIPNTDVPLMIYLQTTEPDGDDALTHKKLRRLQHTDLGAVVARVQKFQNDLPLWQTELRLERLWNFVSHLHRASTSEPEAPLGFNWECHCRTDESRRTLHGHTDTLHVVWDWLMLDATRAREEFANYMRGFDEETGQMSALVRVGESGVDPDTCRGSHPPLWPYLAWKLYLVERNRNFLEEMLRIGLKNAAWWEGNRDTDDDGLFEYAETGREDLRESGYHDSPRFDNVTDKPFASIDLCCQMALFYQCLRRFAAELGETALRMDFEARYEKLADLIRTNLWDESTGFFYDRRDGELVKVRTIASFFSLLAGVATDQQVARMCEHLANEEEFFRYNPVPSVAADETCFETVGRRGPSCPAQTLWVVAGLRNVSRPRLAAQIARRALDAAAEVLERDGTVYELYNPDEPDQTDVRSFGGHSDVSRYHVGSNPVHALASLGLYGIEMTRDGLVVDPVGVALPETSAIEVQLPESRLVVLVKRTDALDGIQVKVRADRRVLAESYGRMVIGMGKLL